MRGAGGKGSAPSARMHLGACCIGDYLVVVGGTVPSCLHHTPVDALVPPAGRRWSDWLAGWLSVTLTVV